MGVSTTTIIFEDFEDENLTPFLSPINGATIIDGEGFVSLELRDGISGDVGYRLELEDLDLEQVTVTYDIEVFPEQFKSGSKLRVEISGPNGGINLGTSSAVDFDGTGFIDTFNTPEISFDSKTGTLIIDKNGDGVIGFGDTLMIRSEFIDAELTAISWTTGGGTDFTLDNVIVTTTSSTQEPSFEITLETAMELAAAAYYLRGDEDLSINPLPVSTAHQAAYEKIASGENGINLLEDDALNLSAGVFADGIYTNGNAAALVATYADTLIISFRGTNDLEGLPEPVVDAIVGLENILKAAARGPVVEGAKRAFDAILGKQAKDTGPATDSDHWFDMDAHYALLEPFIAAIDEYIANSPDIVDVFVTGHSLGGAMAQAYMLNHQNDIGTNYFSTTFASPGLIRGTYGDETISLLDVAPGNVIEDPRVQNYIHNEDAINFPNRTLAVQVGEQMNVELRLRDGTITGPIDQHSADLYLASSRALYETGINLDDLDPGGILELDGAFLQLAGEGASATFSDKEIDDFAGGPNNLLVGSSAEDFLRASSSDQAFAGLEGDDSIQLNIFFNEAVIDPGKSTVIFREGDGIDTLFNFNIAEDQVLLIDFFTLDNAIISGGPASTTVAFGAGDSLIFDGISENDFTSDVFLFESDRELIA